MERRDCFQFAGSGLGGGSHTRSRGLWFVLGEREKYLDGSSYDGFAAPGPPGGPKIATMKPARRRPALGIPNRLYIPVIARRCPYRTARLWEPPYGGTAAERRNAERLGCASGRRDLWYIGAWPYVV